MLPQLGTDKWLSGISPVWNNIIILHKTILKCYGQYCFSNALHAHSLTQKKSIKNDPQYIRNAHLIVVAYYYDLTSDCAEGWQLQGPSPQELMGRRCQLGSNPTRLHSHIVQTSSELKAAMGRALLQIIKHLLSTIMKHSYFRVQPSIKKLT